MRNVVLIVIAVVVVILLVGGCNVRNGMVASKADVDNAWAKVQSAYQRRADLIPNLVATVKGAANFEQTTYIGVAAERAGNTAGNLRKATNIPADSLNAANMAKIQQAGSDAQAAARNFINVSVEAYPQLRATQNFADLQTQLEGTENRINTERNGFNDAARNYNVKVQSFPGNIVAGMFGFKPRPLFEASADAQNAPKVQF